MPLFNNLIDAFFPKRCFGCGALGVYICTKCQKDLKIIDKDACPYCLKLSFFGLTHPVCQRKTGIDGLKSLLFYNVFLKRIIKQIKYRLVTSAVEDLINAIPLSKLFELTTFKDITKNPIIIPTPLSTNRLHRRGFNQSEILSTIIAKKINIDKNFTLLERHIDTKPQVSLKTPKERYLNVRGAFTVAMGKWRLIKNKDLIIIDDVWTTGSTLKEMARKLKLSGARRVYALTLAR